MSLPKIQKQGSLLKVMEKNELVRLTEKTEHGAYWTIKPKGVRETLLFKEELTKLGKLEDIEEELGISLEILFKALGNGFWAKVKNYVKTRPYDYSGDRGANDDLWKQDGYKVIFIKCKKQETVVDFTKNKCIMVTSHEDCKYYGHKWSFLFKSYGKTWALTKEELL